MEELHLMDPRVVGLIIAALFSMLQGSLLYIGRGVFKRLDKINGAVQDHEKRLTKTEIILQMHTDSMDKLIRNCELLNDRVDAINLRCAKTHGMQHFRSEERED